MTVLEFKLPEDRLPDAGARKAIREDLETNILVEAGAGSGKTTALVGRMVRLVVTGTAETREISAVTFTRKAAAELRERFHNELETTLASDELTDEERVRVDKALTEVHDAFLGTIHAFCARLLKERAVEAGLDPSFEPVTEDDEVTMRSHYWHDFLDRLVCDSDPVLEGFMEIGIEPSKLYGAFERVVDNPDLDFPTEVVDPPCDEDLLRLRTELDRLLDLAERYLPTEEPQKGWDSLQKKVRETLYRRAVRGWCGGLDDEIDAPRRAALFAALARLRPGKNGHRPTLNRWLAREGAKKVRDGFNALYRDRDGPNAAELLEHWYAYRYKLCMDLVVKAAAEFAELRRRTGRLTYADLLSLTAKLLRERPRARRDLGLRYRRLLIDEFQDTDPLQAEIAFLLASEPEGDERSGPREWHRTTPRPGALFVVGDPKQSIYRFRRADIELYKEVRAKFERFGRTLLLTTNFRSCPPIGALVNSVFAGPEGFPPEATEEQAAFASLDTLPCSDGMDPSHEHGVFMSPVGRTAEKKEDGRRDEARRIASWIAERISQGSSPGSFMVLTYRKPPLKTYAAALESHRVPYQVTGSGLTAGPELTELRILLDCMADPSNPVCVVAALTGYFFGLDYLALVRHRIALAETEPPPDTASTRLPDPFDVTYRGWGEVVGTDAAAALKTLHGWWKRSIAEPADVFLGFLVRELGLLPHAASSELGSQRAGGLAFVLDAVRTLACQGDASLLGARDAVAAAMGGREVDAPLEPGREDLVRLMNLHQAKGLEADVIVLADPFPPGRHDITFHCARSRDGRAVGYLRISEPSAMWYRPSVPLAHPRDWKKYEDRERRFEKAEKVRLLYVAATRAKNQLAVTRWRSPKKKDSVWGFLGPASAKLGEVRELPRKHPPSRGEVELSPEEAMNRVERAARALRDAARPTYEGRQATEIAMEEAEVAANDGGPPAGGYEEPSLFADASEPHRGKVWGLAVHSLLATAAEGAGFGSDEDDEAREEALEEEAETLLEANGLLARFGDELIEELCHEVSAVLESRLWERVRASRQVLAEAAFEVPRPGSRGVPEIVHGSVDLAFLEDDGWVLVDYKSDDRRTDGFARRAGKYRRQLELYADAWERASGEPVRERMLYFTLDGGKVAW